jgi:hypothetical protein
VEDYNNGALGKIYNICNKKEKIGHHIRPAVGEEGSLVFVGRGCRVFLSAAVGWLAECVLLLLTEWTAWWSRGSTQDRLPPIRPGEGNSPL